MAISFQTILSFRPIRRNRECCANGGPVVSSTADIVVTMHARRTSSQIYGCYGRVVGKNIVEIEDDVGGGKSKTAWKDANRPDSLKSSHIV
jgi:hypothetical protein